MRKVQQKEARTEDKVFMVGGEANSLVSATLSEWLNLENLCPHLPDLVRSVLNPGVHSLGEFSAPLRLAWVSFAKARAADAGAAEILSG